ncbi:unnamed protein product, partial [Allacma fusca]
GHLPARYVRKTETVLRQILKHWNTRGGVFTIDTRDWNKKHRKLPTVEKKVTDKDGREIWRGTDSDPVWQRFMKKANDMGFYQYVEPEKKEREPPAYTDTYYLPEKRKRREDSRAQSGPGRPPIRRVAAPRVIPSPASQMLEDLPAQDARRTRSMM